MKSSVDLLSLVAVLLSAYTLFISFCIYNQQRSIQNAILANQRISDIKLSRVAGTTDSSVATGDGVDVSASLLSSGNYSGVISLLMPQFENDGSGFKDPSLTCIYLRALVGTVETRRQVLQTVERMQQSQVLLSACAWSTYIEALMALRYYADAYQFSAQYSRSFPEEADAHAWMGQALAALERHSEALSILQVARVLIADKFETPRPLLLRLAGSFYAANATVEAEQMYSLAKPQVLPTEKAVHCDVLFHLGVLHVALNQSQLAYVEMLTCLRDCPSNPEHELYLGKALHQLGLLHDATEALKIALKHKATKNAARAEIKAVKATRQQQMDEEVRRAEELLGPQPPVDPSIRRQPNGTYIEFIARLEKEREEQEAKEWAERLKLQQQQQQEQQNAARLEKQQEAAQPTEAANTKQTEASAGDVREASTEKSSSDSRAPEIGRDASVHAPAETSTSPEANAELSQEEAAARSAADSYLTMAAAFTKKEDHAQAVKQLNKAVRRAPQYPAPYVQRAQLLASMGDETAAIADLHKVLLELSPGRTEAAAMLVDIASKAALAGRTAAAVQALQAAGLTLPNTEEFAVAHATVLVRQGDHHAALEALLRVDPAAVRSAEFASLIAMLQAKMGAQQEAQVDGASETRVPAADDAQQAAAGVGVGARHHRGGRWVRHHHEGATSAEAVPVAAGTSGSAGEGGAEDGGTAV